MTGIERLRTLAEERDEWILGGTLADVADQIERERACDSDTAENIRLIVGRVIDGMERHVSGVEGMEDSPVARWARELRSALKSDASDERDAQNPSCADTAQTADVTSEAQKVTRDPAEDVSVSAYDLLPADEREAITWVRDHGGLGAVKERWNRRRNLARQLEKVQAKVERQQRHIEFIQRKCRERQGHIVELNKMVTEMRPRLMPEGMEWPRFEDGEPVRIGDVVSDVEVRSVVFRDGGILLSDCTSVPGWGTWRSYKEPIKRPAKVLDADGAEVRVGDVLYSIETGDSVSVGSIEPGNPWFATTDGTLQHCAKFTHRAPVPASDGEPLHEGEHVWHVKTGREYVVVEPSYGDTAVVRLAKYDDAEGEQYTPDLLTHERPVADSWERLEEDAEKNPCDFFGFDGEETCGRCPASGKNCEQTMARDIVRRAKELAERDAK